MGNIGRRIEMFGGLQALQGERVVSHFETRKTGALLAYLALHLGHAQPRDMLAEILWPDEDLETSRNRLRQALSALRRDLEPEGNEEGGVLLANRVEAQLNFRLVSTDVADFETALRSAGLATTPVDQVSHFIRAAELCRGELLPGYHEEWIVAERDRLREAYRSALGRLSSALLASGDHQGAVECAQKRVAADPLAEDAQCGLMRVLMAVGRPADALRQYRELERLLRQELAMRPSASAQAVLDELRLSTPPATATAQAEGSRRVASPDRQLEAEGGAVPLDSPYYVSRPTDREFATAIARRDSLVLVKGARQIGKTSLLARGLQQARESGAKVVLTDLQKLTSGQLESANALFRTLAEVMTEQLELDVDLDGLWGPQRGWNVNFERFLRREVLKPLDGSVVWGLDEVDRLFGCDYGNEVFGLFRSWHNERSLDPSGPWSRLTLAIAYATEAHLFISDLNQSPFNVGTRLTLEDFTRGEVADLNDRYGSPLRSSEEVKRYCGLVGGHPYLVRRGLHEMVERGLDIDTLEAAVIAEEGPFEDHLRRMPAALSKDPAMREAVICVLRESSGPTADAFWRLRSAGVLAGASPGEARLRCRLYRDYLARHLL